MTNPIKAARQRAGLTQVELAAKLDITQSQIADWESGRRNPAGKSIPVLAAVLDCDPAWIAGAPGMLPVYDWQSETTITCPVIRTEEIEGYGAMYIVDHPDVGWMAVLVAGSHVFTTNDWQGQQPRAAAEIPEFTWVCGNMPTILLNGLPRVVPWG